MRRARRRPRHGRGDRLPQHYIETETSLVQRALRSLKHEDAFAVFDDYGDIGVGRAGPEGVYFNDTRFLSWYELRFEGMRPLLLSSDVQDDNAALSVDLAIPTFTPMMAYRCRGVRLHSNAPILVAGRLLRADWLSQLCRQPQTLSRRHLFSAIS